ncbi:uncharacterized protein BXIN_1179 [Babesia sp. Xinjiang]|uniref:uncharacterized protein n=1 Tax=Babesia sp. Xinjiang TaxID=462227 RepID=UPI000A262E26|nr:uncharacterized protein BXIN_1179 [Babesia sp. Xinjiang]ORM40210.1 hypothetical protein BXIN_1179 [Babesia sp. Xinjiang]
MANSSVRVCKSLFSGSHIALEHHWNNHLDTMLICTLQIDDVGDKPVLEFKNLGDTPVQLDILSYIS